MKKTKIEPLPLLSPHSTVIAGADVDGKPDASKIDPIVYMTYPAGTYNKVGEFLGSAFRSGRDVKHVEEDWE